MTDINDDVLDTMRVYGGSFIQALAELYCVADDNNKAKLADAFTEDFAHCRELTAIRIGNPRVVPAKEVLR